MSPHQRGSGRDVETEVRRDGAARSRVELRRYPEVRWTDARGPQAATLTGRATLGSGVGVDLAIADPTVSRLHAELIARDDGVWVRDLGSRNGTFVGEVRVLEARLPPEGALRVGSTTLRVEAAVAATAVDLWPDDSFGPLVGRSGAMRELFVRLARVAATDVTVLLQGETGTGKELFAEALHEASARRGAPFVVVDCAALAENLLEGELFGHAKGAFTGAVAARAGALESAEGGTVFLDEVGELPLAMQPKLLRAIESRSVRRLGETAYRKVDVRFVSATHRDLRTMVNTGAFREDLYFRLAVVPLAIPPLRERLEDIPQLVARFAPPASAAQFGPELLRELAERPWLGNVRELRNFVAHAAALGSQSALASMGQPGASLPPRAPGAAQPLPAVPIDRPFKEVREAWVDHVEREYIRAVLAKHNRNVTAAANAAGLDRVWVYRLMKKHDL